MNIAAATAISVSPGPLTLLVIEDEEAMRDLLRLTLALEGHNVLTAANGTEGLESAKRLQPDIILCDVNMPGLSGHQVLQELRSDYETRHIPFIFLTGCIEKQSIRLGMAGGAVDYLSKPFRRDELEEAISACCCRLAWSEQRGDQVAVRERCA